MTAPRVVALVLAISVAALAPSVHAATLWQVMARTAAEQHRVNLVAQGDQNLALAHRVRVGEAPLRDSSMIDDWLRQALAAYDAALAIAEEPEVVYRAYAAAVLLDKSVVRTQLIERYVTLMRRVAPRDPRDTEMAETLAGAFSDIAFFGGPEMVRYCEGAVAEYRLIRARVDGIEPGAANARAQATANGAELMMAIGPGQLTEALAWYQEAIDLAPNDVLPYYGAAVAADRGGQPRQAEEYMRGALKRESNQARGRECGMSRVRDDGVFFVPRGDIEFYMGLGCEVGGYNREAMAHYREFLKALPGSPYVARAHERLDALARAQPARTVKPVRAGGKTK